METSHNEIVYKTKKVEYILEKERRARRGSQPTNEMTKMAKFKLWVTSKVDVVILSCEFPSELKYAFKKINGKKNLRTADESVRKAAETWKTAAEMIYKLDDTMTQEEENLCQRANNLRRRSEVTFKTVDATK